MLEQNNSQENQINYLKKKLYITKPELQIKIAGLSQHLRKKRVQTTVTREWGISTGERNIAITYVSDIQIKSNL